jgi:hypothetical protein
LILPKLSFLVHTCDKYSKLWNGWGHYFKKHWSFDHPCDYYFVNETAKCPFDWMKHIPTGSGEFTTRLLFAIDMIRPEFLFYIQEDMWLTRDVNFSDCYSRFINNKYDFLKIIKPTGLKYCEPSAQEELGIFRFKRGCQYLFSHDPGFWKESIYRTTFDVPESPWKHEPNGTRRLWEYYSQPNVDLLAFAYPLDFFHNVYHHGSWRDAKARSLYNRIK